MCAAPSFCWCGGDRTGSRVPTVNRSTPKARTGPRKPSDRQENRHRGEIRPVDYAALVQIPALAQELGVCPNSGSSSDTVAPLLLHR